MLASDINVIQAIGALPLNTGATASLYAVYLKKFAQFVNHPVIINGSIYPEKEYFTDENISAFLYKYFHEKEHKPHFKKAILAAVGSALLYHELPGIFSSSAIYPLTMMMNKVIYIFC